MAFLEAVKETLEAGDPTIRTWPLVNSYWTPVMLTIMYLLFVKRIGPTLMENRKPFDLRLLMVAYNFSIVLTYIVCLLILVYYLFTTDAYKTVCQPVKVVKGDYTYIGSSAGWVIYILKYIEYADTIFFVLRKKNHLITNLHLIHHAALPLISWIIIRTETSSFQFIPGGINAFIHAIMYTYYGLAAMGPEMRKVLWWKEYLTMIQILQFVVILFFVFVIIPLSGCKTSKHGIYIDMFFAALFLGLFVNFYQKTYKKTKRKQCSEPSVQNGTNSSMEKYEFISNGFHAKST